MGAPAILVCTKAVESAVDRHMREQIAFLRDRVAKTATKAAPASNSAHVRGVPLTDLLATVEQIHREEVEHRDAAADGLPRGMPIWLRALDRLIYFATEVAIFAAYKGPMR